MRFSPHPPLFRNLAGGTAVLLLLALGCGGSDSGGGGGGTGTSSAVIRAAGGTVTFQNGAATVVVPAGAVAADTTVTARTPGSLPADAQVVAGTPVEFTPTTFSKPVTLSLTYPASLSEGDAAHLQVAKLVSGAWSVLPSTVDTSHHAVSASVSSFSTYGLYATSSQPQVKAEAYAGPDTNYRGAVRLSWTLGAFGNPGERQAFRFQGYRDSILDVPVFATPASTRNGLDLPVNQSVTYSSLQNPGGADCVNNVDTNTADVPGVVEGRPAVYSIEEIYRVLDTGGPDLVYCYFASTRVATGLATPLDPPALVEPAADATVVGSTSFRFQSAVSPNFSITAEYTLQVSTSPAFVAGATQTLATFSSGGTGTLSTAPVDVAAAFPGAAKLYWRVGVRNVADVPGPVPDETTNVRAVFGLPRSFQVGGNP